MDRKDTKILVELLVNSRLSLTQLAKKIMLSREVLQYRLKKLEKEFIVKYSSQININSLGFKRTGCYIALKNNSQEFEIELLNFLKSHPNIASISSNIGKYDFICDLFYKKEDDLQQISKEIEFFLKHRCKELFFVNIPIEQEFFHNKLIKEQTQITHSKKFESINYSLDFIDKQILSELNKNSRETLVNLSRKCNLKPNAIGYRIKNLEKNNVITNSTIFLRFESLNYTLHNIQIKLINSLHTDKITSFLKSHPNVFYYYSYHGNRDWDIDIGAFNKEPNGLKTIFRDLKKQFGDIIEFKDTYIIEKIYKEELPNAVFQ